MGRPRLLACGCVVWRFHCAREASDAKDTILFNAFGGSTRHGTFGDLSWELKVGELQCGDLLQSFQQAQMVGWRPCLLARNLEITSGMVRLLCPVQGHLVLLQPATRPSLCTDSNFRYVARAREPLQDVRVLLWHSRWSENDQVARVICLSTARLPRVPSRRAGCDNLLLSSAGEDKEECPGLGWCCDSSNAFHKCFG